MRFKYCEICKKLFTQDTVTTVRVNHKKTDICKGCLELAQLRSSEKLTPQEEITLALKEGNIKFKK